MLKRLDKDIDNFDNVYWGTRDDTTIFKEYLEFSRFMQHAFISEDGWIIDTGNFETCNRELIVRIYEKIKKHPLLWKMFFMVA